MLCSGAFYGVNQFCDRLRRRSSSLSAKLLNKSKRISFLIGAEGETRSCQQPLLRCPKKSSYCSFARFFRPLRQLALPASATGGGRAPCPRLRRSSSNFSLNKRKTTIPKGMVVFLAQKERLELSRRGLADLRP